MRTTGPPWGPRGFAWYAWSVLLDPTRFNPPVGPNPPAGARNLHPDDQKSLKERRAQAVLARQTRTGVLTPFMRRAFVRP